MNASTAPSFYDLDDTVTNRFFFIPLFLASDSQVLFVNDGKYC
jgi:hypothetical protein